jgi:hypothetical protein
MDSTEIPVYGQQESSAYNGHFESTCYHPPLLFNRDGDCLAVKMTRLSCHRFRSNEVRLWLSVIAYNLGNLWPGRREGQNEEKGFNGGRWV